MSKNKSEEEKKSWFKRMLDKLEVTHPGMIKFIKYLYGVE